jgi:peroxiredoxin
LEPARALKNFILAAAVAVFLFMAGCEKLTAPPPPEVGDAAPLFSLKDVNGKSWSLSDMRGSVVLINFWATWCPPCTEELPSLQTLITRTMDEPDFTVVSILYRDDAGTAARYMGKMGFNIPLLLDPDLAVAAMYGVTGVPETYVVDGKGVLRKKIIGPTRFDTPYALGFIIDLLRE